MSFGDTRDNYAPGLDLHNSVDFEDGFHMGFQPNKELRAWGKGNSVFLRHGDILPFTGGENSKPWNPFFKNPGGGILAPQGTHMGSWIMNYTRPNNNPYGGITISSMERTIFYSTGHFQPVNNPTFDTQGMPATDIFDGIDFNNWWFDGTYANYHHRGSSPCSAVDMINVGAVGDLTEESKSSYSNCGPRIDIYAPGNNIVSSVNSNVYASTTTDPRNSSYLISKISGTSMASPQVCGVLACALEQYPRMDQEEAKEYIKHYAKSDQMYSSAGGYQDYKDINGSQNSYLYYKR